MWFVRMCWSCRATRGERICFGRGRGVRDGKEMGREKGGWGAGAVSRHTEKGRRDAEELRLYIRTYMH